MKPDRVQGHDPITFEVVRNKVDGIANEMELKLVRSSFSPVVKESWDASCALFTAEGVPLAQAIAIPIHLGTLVPMVERLIAEFPVAGMKDGDVYVMNEPYLGGTHLPDITILNPIFVEGQVIALSAAMTHHQDVGGVAPGSVPTNATEIFQEGLRIPPLVLKTSEGWNETLLKILKLNVRLPDFLMGDLQAQLAACRIGERRIRELAQTYGKERLLQIFEELIDRSERLTRAAISKLPQGRFEAVDYLDNDGVELDKKVRVQVALTIAGDAIEFDFTGTAAQVKGPINCVPSGAMAAAFFAVRAITDPRIPTNGGCFRPVSLVLPEGSLVNPREPAAVNTRTVTIKMMASVMISAMRKAMPDRLPANDAAVMYGVTWGGWRVDGSRFVLGEMIAGGTGAHPHRDGNDVTETDVTNCMNISAEILEMNIPVRLHKVQLRKDSGGAGRHRGGLGVVREYEVLEGPVTIGHRGERFYSQAAGLAGGQNGASGISHVYRADGTVELIPSKREFEMDVGDRLVLQTPGGGGHGSVDERDAGAIAADLAAGRISPEAANETYSLIVL